MKAREKFRLLLESFGLKAEPADLARFKISEGALGTYDVGGYLFFATNSESAQTQWQYLLERERNKPHSVTSDGRRWRSESGRLYPFDGENPAESVIQKGLATFELPPFSFAYWPARYEGDKIIVGTGRFEVKWPKCESKSDFQSFLRSVAVAEPFRLRAAESSEAVTSAADSEETLSEEVQQWFKNAVTSLGGEATT